MVEPQLVEEVIGLARDLIRIDTSNPPGRETPAAELLAAYLGAAGIESELVGPDPERLNLVARVAGRGDGPSLDASSPTPTVRRPGRLDGAAVRGEVEDGRLIGRGATDMKDELAARAVALAALGPLRPGPRR